MAPIITTNTVRYKVRYRAFGLPHSFNFRFARGTSAATASELANFIVSEIYAAWPSSQVASDLAMISAVYSPEDNPDFLPVASVPTVVPGAADPATLSKKVRSTYIKASGRGGNRNVNLTIFGIAFSQDALSENAEDGIIASTESARWAMNLVSIQTRQLVAINNVLAVWNTIANVKQHDYWRDQLKGA